MMRFRSLTLLLVCAVALGGCGGGGEETEQTSKTTQSRPADTSTTSAPTTTTTEPEGTLVAGSVEIEDPSGYTYKAEVAVRFEKPEVNLADARPGDAFFLLPITGTVSMTNTTPGRNVTSYPAFSLRFPQETMARFGPLPPNKPNYTAPCPNTDGNCRVAGFRPDEGPPIPPDSTIEMPIWVENLQKGWQVSEAAANGFVELLAEGVAPTLYVYLEQGYAVSNCDNVIAYVKRDNSIMYERAAAC